MRIGVLCSRVRVEEKLLFAALQERRADHERIDPDAIAFDLGGESLGEYDAVLVRCLSHSQAYYLTRWLESRGVPSVNSHRAVATCGDKLFTSAALQEAAVPIPHTVVAFTPEAALEAIGRIGYPVVLKPVHGSWGRLMAKVNDRQAAEMAVEHKLALDRSQEAPIYIQDYVDKPGRDMRTIVVGEETVCAIYRRSSHWITNTARGGDVSPLPITEEVDRLSRAAAAAVGGGIVAVDILEGADGALLVNEVNHTPEFHGAMRATGADIVGKMVEYLLRIAKEGP